MVGVNCGVVGADYELVETREWRDEMFTKKETPQDPHATGDLCGVHSHMQSYPANPMKSTHVLESNSGVHTSAYIRPRNAGHEMNIEIQKNALYPRNNPKSHPSIFILFSVKVGDWRTSKAEYIMISRHGAVRSTYERRPRCTD